MLLSIILNSLLCSIIMTQLGNLLPGQKSVSFKIIQGQVTRTVYLTYPGVVIGVSRFIICHFNILYCRYCLVYDNLYIYIYIYIYCSVN